MDPGVAQLEDASLQSHDQPLHVQKNRVEPDSSLVVRRRARRIARLLLHLESCQIYGESSNDGHSLHDREWKHEEAERG